MQTQRAIQQLPKVELHLHLEGAIPLPALWNLIVKYNGTEQAVSLQELNNRFVFKDFPHFIDTWVWKNQFLREYEDFTYIAQEVAADLVKQNVIYAEVYYSPGDFRRSGLELKGITRAIRKGLDVHAHEITIYLITDLVRDFGPELGMQWLNEVNEIKDELGVIGIGIGGSEQSFPPEAYEEVYEKAREMGLRTTAHAGEAAGASSIWGAVNTLKVDRIGHCTRATEDPDLIRYLKEHQIPLEMCPLSNLRTAVVSELTAHPIRQFFDAGLLVCVNTDDPKMFNNSLEEEYIGLMEHLSFTFQEIVCLIRNAINSTWCSAEKRQELHDRLNSALETLAE